jgi:hypothetical protein
MPLAAQSPGRRAQPSSVWLDSEPSRSHPISPSRSEPEAIEPTIRTTDSALDRNVALAARMRFQMINAMAMFDPSVSADVGVSVRKQSTAPLLTSLPGLETLR